MRHLSLAIGEIERDQWLACVDRAIRESDPDSAFFKRLNESFLKTADVMCNQPGAM
jgi:hemoglobin